MRYPTVGLGVDTDASRSGSTTPVGVAMAHNGNVTNFHELKRTRPASQHPPLRSNCEVVLYVFADALMRRANDPVTVDDVQAAVRCSCA